MSASIARGKITLNVFWKGNIANPRIKDLHFLFKGATTHFSVEIPNRSCFRAKRLPFIYQKEEERREAQSLRVTAEQIHHLTIKAIEQSPDRKSFLKPSKTPYERSITPSGKNIRLVIPEKLEVGQTYNLQITPENASFSAHLLRVRKAAEDVVQKQAKYVKEQLFREWMEDIGREVRGFDPIEDLFSPKEISFKEQLHSIMVSDVNPLESLSTLRSLPIEKLEEHFLNIFEEEQELKNKRVSAALMGNPEELEILHASYAHTQILENLHKEFERRGIFPPTPEDFQEPKEEPSKILKALQECKIQ